MKYYPISLDKIEEKVARKNEREKTNSNPAQYLLFDDIECSNVKEEINEFGERITEVNGDITVDLPVSDEQRFLFISHDQTVLTHGLHKYPANFFPELPKWLIKRYSDVFLSDLPLAAYDMVIALQKKDGVEIIKRI